MGIGRPTTLELAKFGANVTIIGRNEVTCSEAVDEITQSTGNQKVFLTLSKWASYFYSSMNLNSILVLCAPLIVVIIDQVTVATLTFRLSTR